MRVRSRWFLVGLKVCDAVVLCEKSLPRGKDIVNQTLMAELSWMFHVSVKKVCCAKTHTKQHHHRVRSGAQCLCGAGCVAISKLWREHRQ